MTFKTSTAINPASRVDVLAAYSYAMFKVGAEYFSAENNKPATNRQGGRFFSVRFCQAGGEIAVFVRYDEAKPNKNTNSA